MDERWHLRPELEFTDCIDSWRVRSSPVVDAPVVGVLQAGQAFTALGVEGQWVQVRCDDGVQGWSRRKLSEISDADALAPVSSAPGRLTNSPTLQPARLQREVSDEQRITDLLRELGERRKALNKVQGRTITGDPHVDVVLAEASSVQAAAEVQATMAKLELLGVDEKWILSMEGSDGLEGIVSVMDSLRDDLKRKTSFQHSEFVNPHAESCWLSTFFQSLWHSRVFHTFFDQLIRPLPSNVGGELTNALRETWHMYEQAARNSASVPVRALRKAWGQGYGDCSDAFGMLDKEEVLKPLAEQIALIPVLFSGSTLTPHELWAAVLDMGRSSAPLIAIDLQLPPLASADILTLALAIVPRKGKGRGELEDLAADLGNEHRLVAVICYMEAFSHYVVFCRRQSDSNNWLFFNDLPSLARGALRELPGWPAVAHECARSELRPKVLLYESPAGAQRVIAKASPELVASASLASRQDGSNRRRKCDSLIWGGGACIAVIMLALAGQQVREIMQILSPKV